jgi:hypothetical protein
VKGTSYATTRGPVGVDRPYYHRPIMTLLAARLAASLLAATFAWAAAAKLVRWRAWRAALREHGVSGRGAAWVAAVVPLGEAVTAVILVAWRADVGGASALAALSVFSLVAVRLRSRAGGKLPCGCFGGESERDYRWILLRNSLLAAGAAFILATPLTGAAWSSLASPPKAGYVPASLVVVGLLLGAWTLRRASLAMRGERRP